MIELMTDLPHNVIGLEAKGKVTGGDYERVIMPLVEERLKEHEKLRLLYWCGEDFDGVDMKAIWDDAKIGLRHFKAWEKLALVTDHEWMRNMTKMFGFMMPCPVQVYDEADIEAAKAWIVE